MPRHRHRSSKSNFPVSGPASSAASVPPPFPLRPESGQPFDMGEVFRLLEEEDTEAALEMLDSAPKWMQKSDEFRLMRVSVLMQAGDLEQAGELLREMERKNPRFLPLYLPLSIWYMMQNWPAHALKAARKAQSAKFDEEASEQAQDIIETAGERLDGLAARLNISREKAEQASWHNEQAQLAVLENRLSESERASREALKIAPRWVSPRNNYAHALYRLGKILEAIAQAEAVLSDEPDNLHALNNLALFHTGLGHPEQAATAASQLFELASGYSDDSDEMDIVLSALSLVEDTEHLWQLARRYRRKPTSHLSFRSWHILGVAAIRKGEFKEAKTLLLKASEDGNMLSFELLERLNETMHRKQTRLTWPPAYPGLELMVSGRVLNEWDQIVKSIEGDLSSPAQQRKIDAFLAKHPAILAALKKMLWIEEISRAGARGLALFNKPEADAELLRFAFSDVGDSGKRLHAAMLLVNAKRLNAEKPIRFWDETKQKWQEVHLFSQRIGDVAYAISPKAMPFIQKAQQAKNPDDAIAFLRRAIEVDPACAMAMHNLGAFLRQKGETEEGERLIRRSIEMDPAYTFGFANLGLIEAQRGNKEAALDLLLHVQKAKIITYQTACVSSLAYAVIAIDDKDFERAERHLDTAREMNPDNPAIEKIENMLRLNQMFGEDSFVATYQRDSAHRFHKKALKTPLTAEMTLEACLGNLTNETLSAMCRFWETYGTGKKPALVDALKASILDAEIFDEITQELTDKEREALKTVIEAGGWRPWQEFTAQFGDDWDESPGWKYYDPESVPGRLKLAGLLYAGTLGGQQAAYIPVDIRPLVEKLVL